MRPSNRGFSRRDVLRGLRGGDGSPAASPDGNRSRRGPGTGDLIRASRPAMGSYFEVRVPAGAPGAVDLATRALDVIDDLEWQMTIYRDDSELSRVNATAHLGPVVVEAGLFQLLRRAFAIGEATGGAYDITTGALSMAWGFVRGPKRVPAAEALAEARERSGQAHVTLDEAAGTVAFDRPGIVLNLGSIGKGYAIDRAADVVRGYWWPTPALVHGGQSSLFTLGSPPDRFGGRWDIALRNPFDPDAPLGTIRLRNRGLGTSGGAFQSFEVDGRQYGHIVDPRTGEPPADGPASVTVLAPTAADADALSTAFYLLGYEGSRAYADAHPDIGAIFIEAGPDPGTPRIRTHNLTMADFVPNAAVVLSGLTT